jgi:hypothetical protein
MIPGPTQNDTAHAQYVSFVISMACTDRWRLFICQFTNHHSCAPEGGFIVVSPGVANFFRTFIILSSDWVIIDRIWTGNWIYWTFVERNYKEVKQAHWFTYSKHHCHYSTHKVFSVFTSRCLVTASSGGRSPSSGFSSCPRPQLPASHFSQLQIEIKVRITLQLAVYRQSVRLSAKPLETHDKNFFQLNPCGHSF